jgi:hypothetical protein
MVFEFVDGGSGTEPHPETGRRYKPSGDQRSLGLAMFEGNLHSSDDK